MSGRYERQKPKKKGGKIALIVVIVLIVLIGAGVFAGWAYYNSILNSINRVEVVDRNPSDEEIAAAIGGKLPIPEEETTEATEPTEETVEETTVPETKPMTADDIVNILVVGQSARPGEESRMADSTILFTINKYTKTVTLSSVHRDAFVKGPDYKGHNSGRIKFAACYALGYVWGDIGGAMECLNQVMEKNFGVEVDYNFEVDMEAFMKFIDTLGGIGLELTAEEAAYLTKDLKGYAEFEEGYCFVDGFTALSYARMRKAQGDNESDVKRTARQRYLVEQVIATLKYTLATQGLPVLQDLAREVLPYMSTNMENDEITRLLADLVPILPDLKIEKGTIPVEGSKSRWGDMVDIYKDGVIHSVIRFDENMNKKAMRYITEAEGEYPDTGK